MRLVFKFLWGSDDLIMWKIYLLWLMPVCVGFIMLAAYFFIPANHKWSTIFIDKSGLARCLFELHCNGNSVYKFLIWELRSLSPNFHIHVSVSELYIPRIGPHISSSRKGSPIVGIYNSLTDTWMWKLVLRPRYSFSGNICIKFSAFCLCSVH